MACNIVTGTIYLKKERSVAAAPLKFSLSYILIRMSTKMCRSRLPVPVPNWITLGGLCQKWISDPFKCLEQAINTTYRMPYDFMMVISCRKKLVRGNGGAFKNADRLYSDEICFPLNRVRQAARHVGGTRKADYCLINNKGVNNEIY